ncbi:MAG: hypothetical protein ABJA02_05470 [Acidobacteriota bacterium]
MTNTGLSQTNSFAAETSGVNQELIFQLGAWAAGLESFLKGGGLSFGDRRAAPEQGDHLRELRIARGTLQRCSNLAFRILATSGQEDHGASGITLEELRDFSSAIRETLLLAGSISRSKNLNVAEWHAWSRSVTAKLDGISGYAKLIAVADTGGESYLPEKLRKLIANGQGTRRAELESILPRFGRILKLLNIVNEMLASDEPLKPAILIFCKVSEHTQDLIGYLNERIERSRGADDEFISALDGASYTASIELKKVVNQELAGLTAIRPPTTVFARTEAAHALLTESFQQILTGFARQFDPTVDAFQLFSNFGEKLERSLLLRNETFEVLKLVHAAEKDPDKPKVIELNKALVTYVDQTLGYLFYKDTETFERFVDEILVTRQKKDLVPILHRFGAYLETLFAQISMRAVLEQHPFVQSQG